MIYWNGISILLCGAVFLLLWNEFLVYYAVLIRCYWPSLNGKQDYSLTEVRADSEILKAMFLADTHLLGKHGHWFDTLRREWQMRRTFQAAKFLFDPDVVFILGDLLDEGKSGGEEEFTSTALRFQRLFSVGEHTELQLVVGNHDIGFHYMASPANVERFERRFHTPPVRQLHLKGNIFVLLNSVAFEGDQCQLCRRAVEMLNDVYRNLTCLQEGGSDLPFCLGTAKLPYSRPIVLQHYPMYRESDAGCEGPDSAPDSEKFKQTQPKYDCLSKDASDKILELLHPRLVVDAHTHHFCQRTLSDGTPEWTVPSFNWRNKVNPSFILGSFTPNQHSLGKCYMPREDTVIGTYILGGATVAFLSLLHRCARTVRHRRTRSIDRYIKFS